MVMRQKPPELFKAFLSHRYRSPEINKYFYKIFSESAEIQFEVDVGTKPTNVTRLERLMRDSDAFIGIYPLPLDEGSSLDLATALKESQYFRLELDLAIRSRRPAIVFIDSRYGDTIAIPPSVIECRFDHREPLGFGASTKKTEYINAFNRFLKIVSASIKLKLFQSWLSNRNKVGLLLPTRDSTDAYKDSHFEIMEKYIRAKLQTPVHLLEPYFDGKFFRQIEEIDWLIADIGKESCSRGVVSYFHGCFVPMMRLIHSESGVQTKSPLEDTLFSSHKVGYPKDIVRWSDDSSLETEFKDRLAVIYEPRHPISTLKQADEYFSKAELRKEAVFVSYSGEDRELAQSLIGILKKQFQNVFDYRDQGESILPGRPWMEEIFARLSVSAIGVPFLSKSYLESGNCRHEGQQMIALCDAGKMIVIPIKLYSGTLELPAWLANLQYLRFWEYSNDKEKAVSAVIDVIDKHLQPTS